MLILSFCLLCSLLCQSATIILDYTGYPRSFTQTPRLAPGFTGSESWTCDSDWTLSSKDHLTCNVTLAKEEFYYMRRFGYSIFSRTASGSPTAKGLSNVIQFSDFDWNIPSGISVTGVTLTMTKRFYPNDLSNLEEFNTWTSGFFDYELRLRKANGQLSDNQAQLPPYSVSDGGINYEWCPGGDTASHCTRGAIDFSMTRIQYQYGGPSNLWNANGRSGKGREVGSWTGQGLTVAELTNPSFGVDYSVVVNDYGYTGDSWVSVYTKNAIIDQLSLTAHTSLTWTLDSISPTSGSSTNPPVVTLSVTGLFNTGKLTCRWKFPDDSVVIVNATYVSPTTATCVTPSNFGDPGVAEVDISIDGGKTYSGLPKSFAFLIACKLDCGSNGLCNNVTGVCGCTSPGTYGEACEFSCSQIADINSCTQCSNRDNSVCPFCLETFECGPCPNSTVSNPFGIGSKIRFIAGEQCPQAASVNSTSSLNPLSNSSVVLITGINFDNTVNLFCKFGDLNPTPATVISSTEIKCPVPSNPNVPDNSEVAVSLSVVAQNSNSTQFHNYAQSTFPFVYGQFLPQTKEGSTTSTTVGEIAAYIAAGVAVLGLCCFGLFGKYTAYKKRQADDKYRSFHMVPEFGYAAAFSYIYALPKVVSRDFSENPENWKSFSNLVSSENRILIDFISDNMSSVQDDVVRACVYIFENSGNIQNLLHYLIFQEVRNCDNPKNLFRGANFASKAWSGWIRMDDGLKYLHKCLSAPLYETCSNFGDASVELNPAVRGDETSSGVDKYRLMAAAQTILHSIFENDDITPPMMRIILTTVRKAVKSRYPEFTSKIVGGFVFLRYFCPAIASPITYGLLGEEPNDSARRLLILISKTLMNLANGIQFGVKEDYMQILNDFIVENNRPCIDYLQRLASMEALSDSDSDSDSDEILNESTMIDPSAFYSMNEISHHPLPENVYEISLSITLQFLRDNYEALDKTLESTDPKFTTELKRLLEELPTFKLTEIEDDFY